MFAFTSLARPMVRQSLAHSRQMSAITGPAAVRISFAEKLIHSALIVFGLLATPAWVLTNVKNYRARG